MLSIGRHPVSNKTRISPADRRAIGVALAADGGPVTGVHAGWLDPDMVYNIYGYGLAAVHCVETGSDTDALPPLLGWWMRHRPAVILFGTQTEQGEGSGTLPYFFAETLGLPLVSGVVAVASAEGRFEVTQAMSASNRRSVTVESPFVAIASPRAGLPLGFSHAAAQWGRAETIQVEGTTDRASWPVQTIDASIVRPRSLRSDVGCSLEQRLSGLVGGERAVRQHYLNASPTEAAQVIVDALEGLGLLQRDRFPDTSPTS